MSKSAVVTILCIGTVAAWLAVHEARILRAHRRDLRRKRERIAAREHSMDGGRQTREAEDNYGWNSPSHNPTILDAVKVASGKTILVFGPPTLSELMCEQLWHLPCAADQNPYVDPEVFRDARRAIRRLPVTEDPLADF